LSADNLSKSGWSCRKVIWLFVAELPLWPQLTPAQGDTPAVAVYAPRPTYPFEARARHLQGSGTEIVTVDPATGNVINVVMAMSTGSGMLDDAALSAFRHWRFKPGTVSKLRIPITFTLSRGGGSIVRVEKALPMDQVLAPFLGKENVINAPIPVYPSSPPWTSKEGRGVYELHVNKAGAVTEVKTLKSSGDPTSHLCRRRSESWRSRSMDHKNVFVSASNENKISHRWRERAYNQSLDIGNQKSVSHYGGQRLAASPG